MIDSDKLQEAVGRFGKASILVIGDVIVDQFIWGTVTRISPEAPVPVVNVNREELLLGGSANVLKNIYSLGGRGSCAGSSAPIPWETGWSSWCGSYPPPFTA